MNKLIYKIFFVSFFGFLFHTTSLWGQQAKPDLADARILCDTRTITVDQFIGAGTDGAEASDGCLNTITETNTTWFSWEGGALEGELSFTIEPNNPNDQFAFTVFLLPNGLNDGAGKTSIGCVLPCRTGPVGLRMNDGDFNIEDCATASDGFIEPIFVENGSFYGLMIENTTSTEGFTIDFSGNVEFVGPKGEIMPSASEVCFGSPITFNNNVANKNGNIINYSWTVENNLGQIDTTTVSQIDLPQTFNFKSTGSKNVVLTVVSNLDQIANQNCTATFELPIEINKCCDSDNKVEIFDNATRIDSIKCPSDANGAIDISAESTNPGQFPIQYQWSNQEITQDLINLSDGIYSLTVSNDAGCRDSAEFNLLVPNALTATATETQPACPMSIGNAARGAIEVSVSGGRAPYSYNFGDGNFISESTINDLDTGDYEVIVMDASGCTDTIQGLELDFKELEITFDTIPISCFGLDDGQVIIPNPPNGTAPFNYSINGSAPLSADALENLAPGNYTIDVFDSEGCTGNPIDFVMRSPESFTARISEGRKFCNRQDDGFVAAVAQGGAEPFNYEWNNGSTGNVANDLLAGDYWVTITDDNGCKAESDTFDLMDNPPLVVSVANVTDASCSSVDDGQIELDISGGVMPYSYSLDGIDFQTGSMVTNLVAGDYDIVVQDNFNCVENVPTTTIAAPESLSFDIDTNADICYGESISFTNTSTFTRGNPVSVTWDINGTTITGDNPSKAFTTIGNPSVTLTIETDLNCTATITDTLDIAITPCCDKPENVITFSANSTNPLCANSNNGSITLNASSIVPPITNIKWSNTANTDAIDNLTAGDYTVTVTNDATCESIQTFNLSSPAPIEWAFAITAPTCEAATNGAINITASGGTVIANDDYEFDFGNGFSTVNDFDDLGIGNYPIIIRDLNNCMVTADTTLAVPAGFSPIQATINQVPPTCETATNGEIFVIASGNTAGYIYDFGNGFSTQSSATNLGPGNYTITIQDPDNCTLDLDTELAVPDGFVPISAQLTITTPSCEAANNGFIAVTAIGSGGNFEYDFGNGFSTQSSLTDLTVGNYPITVRDGNNCTLTIDTSLAVAPDANPVQATLQISQPSCGGMADGVLTVLTSGESGTDPTNYQFDFGTGNLNSNTNSGLSAGPQLVVVTNENNCSITLDTMLAEKVLESTTPLVVRPTCFELSNGSIEFNIPNGIGPFTYDFGDGIFQDAAALTNLSQGTYEILIQDDEACQSIVQNVIIDQPDELVLNLDPTNISCFGADDGRIAANISGGVGNYTFDWSNGQTSNIVGMLPAGDYSLDVTDGNDCPVSSNTVTIIEPAQLFAEVGNVDNVLCFGEPTGAISVNASGGSGPYEYSLDGVIFQPEATLASLSAGDYMVIVKDSRECEINTPSVTIDEPEEFVVTAAVDDEQTNLGFTVNLSADANTTTPGTINYTWSTPDSIICNNCQSFETVPPGSTTFTVIATNPNNCQATDEIKVAVSLDRPVYIPNIFSPNGDGINDEFFIPFSPSMRSIEQLQIFDRSGTLVFETSNIQFGEEFVKSWDGEFNGSKIRQGVFVVVAQINFIDNQTLPYQSDLTLISSE